MLKLPSDFQNEEDPAKWQDMESFPDARERVNGVTERGVALAQEFMEGAFSRSEKPV